ncbi:MAG: hypothetical protein MJE63_03425 [Proteobacteria bacterium]|nr:hypothetical protein [Pseudomonadota bacterium]
MKEKTKFSFNRKDSVKDLFNNEILGFFDYIHINSLSTLYELIKCGYENIKCIRLSHPTFDESVNLIENRRSWKTQTYIDIESDNYDTIDQLICRFPEDEFRIYTSSLEIAGEILNKHKSLPNGQEFLRKGSVCYKLTITSNFEAELSRLINSYYKNEVNLFEIKIDYFQFEDLKMANLHRLAYWFNELSLILNLEYPKNPDIVDELFFYNHVYIDNDLKMYLSNSKNYFIFDLLKYQGMNGEDIDSETLNRLRQVVDISFTFPMSNLIDLEQNMKIMNNICEIPHLNHLLINQISNNLEFFN